MSEDDSQLRHYAINGDDVAFKAVVECHLPLVYSTALRQVNGDTHLAQDIAQQVFAALARSAKAVAGRGILTSWLYRTTRNLSANAVRAERRRRLREEAAAKESMHLAESTEQHEADWQQVSVHLDEAMAELSVADHTAILLRYFRRLDFRAIGEALGVSDDTAQKRVARALDKLRQMLSQRGVTLSIAALGTLLAGNAVAAAPTGLAAAIVAGIQAGVPAATGNGVAWAWAVKWATAGGIAAIALVSCLLVWGPWGGGASTSVFDLARDFPPPADGSGPWSYGWASTLGGPMRPIRHRKEFSSANNQPLLGLQVSVDQRPALTKNMGAGVAISAGGAFEAPPGALWIGPELGETERRFAVVRFTTPAGHAGEYRLTSMVEPVLRGATSGDTDYHILLNGVERFGRFLDPDAGATYSNRVRLEAGDTIDFVVGQGRDTQEEGAVLRMDAVLVPEQAAAGRAPPSAKAPVILAPPSPQRVVAGGPAVFEVDAIGQPPLRYHWWFGETPLGMTSNANWRLPSVQSAQAGQYHVVVSNALGSVRSAPARLALVSCVPVPPGLVAWWRGEQNVLDALGSQHGTLLPGTTFGSGRVGQAFVLTGPEAGLTLPASPSLDVGAGGAFSVEMWVKPDEIAGVKLPLLGWNSLDNVGANLSAVDGVLYANVRDIDGNSHAVNAAPDCILLPGQWKHVVLTHDNESQVLRLFVNGYRVGEVASGPFRANTTLDLQIGWRIEGGVRRTCAGRIDEVSLYRRALSPAEVRALTEAGTAGKCAQQLTASLQPGPERTP